MKSPKPMNSKKSLYWWVFLVTCVIGLVDSLYLLWIKIANDKVYCLQGIGDCWTVNTSRYSSIAGIPISVFGILGYALILAVFILEEKHPTIKEHGLNILFGLTLLGALYSIYLTYLELFVIYAICPFCVVSALAMLVLFGQTVYRLVKHQATL